MPASSAAEHLRLFLQEVDGAFLKLGQILAMRVDFLPEEYIRELLKLLDAIPPFDPEIAKSIVEDDLQGRIPDIFQTFSDAPIAAASFGQVHAATLPNGANVVVKIQRPSVPDTIAADLKLFRFAAFLIDATGLTGRMPLKPVFEEFADWTRDELDYRIEGSHVQEIHDKAAGWRLERIPKVYWSHTSSRVLTLERLEGLWVKEIIERLQRDKEWVLEALAKRNTTLFDISQNLFRNTLRQIFVYGIFHADPHAANLLVMNDGVIGYVDFGITGRITDDSKKSQVRVHVALESGDVKRFFTAVLELMDTPYFADLPAFERDLKRLYLRWLTAQWMGGRGNLQDKSFARMMLGINRAAQRSGAALGSAEVRVFRALATVDAVLLQFAPDLDLRSELRYFFGAYMARRLVAQDVPRLLHRLPEVVDILSHRLDAEVSFRKAYVSRSRRTLGIMFQVLGIGSLVVAGVLAILPQFAHPVLTRLHLGRGQAVLLSLLATAWFAWLSHLLKLRSVVAGVPVEELRAARRKGGGGWPP
ncbi:MAG: hypothetical protein LAO23_17415 [Acidobacteriia bacterium]|nr:hypothetical protein [Terriglobia bacterium]